MLVLDCFDELSNSPSTLFKLSFTALLALLCTGCERYAIVLVDKQIIAKPAILEVNLEGTWQVVSDESNSSKNCDSLIVVKQEDGLYELREGMEDDLTFSVRGTELNDDNTFAIIEISSQEEGMEWCRCLAIIKRDGDYLSLWLIGDWNLESTLAKDGYEAKVERGLLHTKVSADPKELLTCIRAHPKEFVGERTLYRLASDI